MGKGLARLDQAPHLLRDGLYALQPLVRPQPIHPVPGLTLRRQGRIDLTPEALIFTSAAVLRLDTAYNVFPLGKWRRHCGLSDLRVVLRGEGRFTLTVTAESGTVPHNTLHAVDLRPGEDFDLPLSPQSAVDVLHLTLRAEGQATLTDVIWASTDAPRRLPQIALSMTTFGREAAALAAIPRFVRETEGQVLAPFLTLQVVDNGQTLPPTDHPRVKVIANRNLGGAGGFAWGLSEARAAGASHCVFMDDDASVGFDAVARTWTFLAHATDPRTAIAGALMSAAKPTRIWENGALFDEVWQPLSAGRDLAKPGGVMLVEYESRAEPPPNFYGGFWYYAFPLTDLRQGLFPFFVRGDDTSFCVANQFRNVTLPGVICFQDVDFSEKESALTLYLDLRSNLIHHLTLPPLDRGRKIASVPLRLFRRALGQHHLDTLKTLNWAIEDVLAGPDRFAAEPDAASRRAAIAKARKHEVWRPLDKPVAVRRRINPKKPFQRILFGLSLNGTLLPFFGLWGDRITLPQAKRGSLRPCWGAARVSYLSLDGSQVMELRHSKWVAWTMGLRMAWNITRLFVTYPTQRTRWREGYARIATEDWWQKQFQSRD